MLHENNVNYKTKNTLLLLITNFQEAIFSIVFQLSFPFATFSFFFISDFKKKFLSCVQSIIL